MTGTPGPPLATPLEYEYPYNAIFDYSVVLFGVIMIRYARNSYTCETIKVEACSCSSKRLIKYTNHSKITDSKWRQARKIVAGVAGVIGEGEGELGRREEMTVVSFFFASLAPFSLPRLRWPRRLGKV